jgi:acetylornithine deacetylase
MLDSKLADDILQSVDEGFDEQIAFTQDLVRHPSQRGQEHTAQDFMFEAMKRRGLAMDRWSIDVNSIKDHPGFSPVAVNYDNAINVVGAHRPREATGKSLILNGHIDVVPTGPLDMWSFQPYEPALVDGWMHGRGAGDMKAGLGINLYAFDALKRIGVQPAAAVYLQSVTEEECTGNGALSCLTRGYHADAAIITEPSSEYLTRANVGVIWFSVEVRGRPAHVLESNVGNNAIISTYKIIDALQALEKKWNAKKVDHPLFADLEKPITINIGRIEGGDWPSSVPCWCRIDVRAGIYPGTNVAEAQAEIEAAIRASVHDDPYLSNHPPAVTYNGFTAEGYVLEKGGEAEACLRACHAHIFQRELADSVTPAYLDGRVFVLYDDTPALVYGPISERIHGFDERVELESIRQVTKSVALFMARWCGTESVHA